MDLPISSCYFPLEGVVSTCNITKGEVALKILWHWSIWLKLDYVIPPHTLSLWCGLKEGETFLAIAASLLQGPGWRERLEERSRICPEEFLWDFLAELLLLGTELRNLLQADWCVGVHLQNSVKYYGCVNFNQYSSFISVSYSFSRKWLSQGF